MHSVSIGQRKTVALDVILPDTFARSHLNDILTLAGASANYAAMAKMSKYTIVPHMFALTATWRQWVHGIERQLKQFKKFESNRLHLLQQLLMIHLRQPTCCNECPVPRIMCIVVIQSPLPCLRALRNKSPLQPIQSYLQFSTLRLCASRLKMYILVIYTLCPNESLFRTKFALYINIQNSCLCQCVAEFE